MTKETRAALEWAQREGERRARDEGNAPANTGLLSPERFSNDYAPTTPELPGEHGPGASAIRGLLAGSCAGWRRQPSSREFYEAMRANEPTRREQNIASVLIAEGSTDEIVLAHLQGAFTWRQLVRMMHRRGLYSGKLARFVNKHAQR